MMNPVTVIDEQSGINGDSSDLQIMDVVVDQPDRIDKQLVDWDEQDDRIDASGLDEELTDIEFLNYNGDVKGLLVGVRAKKWEELHQLYRDHSNAVGFTIKKGTVHRYKCGKISGYYFLCNCEGKTNRHGSSTKGSSIKTPPPVTTNEAVLPSPIEKDLDLNKAKKQKRMREYRSGCKARMRVKWMKEHDLYEVTMHYMEHNHDLTATCWSHLKKSERSISNETGELIERFVEAGIRTKDGYNMLVKAAGGEEFVGHTKKDYQNRVTKLKVLRIEGGDAQSLYNRLCNLKKDDPGFYFDIKLGLESELEMILWCDAMMIRDFMLYGDVVIFDTTYNTNRYNMICAPIVGINNHWNTVMFGCAFITNETKDSFTWILKSFRTAMGGKEPKTIFTDQDQAMANAIKEVYEGRVRHRLCLWHITQNAQGHFGHLKGDETFKAMFDKCLMGCTSEVEFENCWNEMMDTFNFRGESWFEKLYGFKDKWCTAFSKDFFSAGILSSQRSESTNHAICFDAKRTTSLTEFLDIFNNTVLRWRSTEQKKEFESVNYQPQPHMYGGLVTHAAEVYTIEIFKFFEHEAKASFAAPYHFTGYLDLNTMLIHVAHEKNPYKYEAVTFKRGGEDITVDCSCNHFSEVGWLCFHSIKALNLNNVHCIPEKYIVRRWTKKVKIDIWNETYQGRVSANPQEQLPWMQFMARKFYDLMLVCHDKPGAKKLIENCYNNAALEVKEFLSPPKNGPTVGGSTINQNELTAVQGTVVKDPKKVATKGRPKTKNVNVTTKFTQKKKPDTSNFPTERNKHLI